MLGEVKSMPCSAMNGGIKSSWIRELSFASMQSFVFEFEFEKLHFGSRTAAACLYLAEKMAANTEDVSAWRQLRELRCFLFSQARNVFIYA
jgi:hypothetical protein